MSKLIQLCGVAVLACALTLQATTARAIGFIRDAEIENTIRIYGAPIFAMAGLTPASVRVYIVNDSSLNAFVAGGQNIFFNTGLILASETPNQLIGVLAHETGHISGGHLARTHDALRNATAQTILTYVLGAAAALAGGGAAASAVVAGGQQIAQRGFLSYSRLQEASADQAALTYLDRTGQSSRGLMEFFDILGDQEALLTANQDPYVRTHPLTRERVDTVRAHVERSPFGKTVDPPEYLEMHARMKAKLSAYLDSPVLTYRRYPDTDRSVAARYARSIALHKQRQVDASLALIDELLREEPQNAYFFELKGQVLLENGRPDDAVGPYAEAVRLLPNEVLLRQGLGHAQITAHTDRYLPDAVKNLERAAHMAPQEPDSWRWLAVAHGRLGNVAEASLATAERYLILGRYRDAIGQAERAKRALNPGTPAYLRAEDIQQAARTEAGLKEPAKKKR